MQHRHNNQIYEVVESLPGSLRPTSYQQLTGLTTAQGLPGLAGLPDNDHIVYITAEGNDVRWRDDGTDPTATVGMPLQKDTLFIYTGNPNAIRFAAKAGSAILNATYYT